MQGCGGIVPNLMDLADEVNLLRLEQRQGNVAETVHDDAKRALDQRAARHVLVELVREPGLAE